MFNEQEWIRLVFLLADTQGWVDALSKEMYLQLPVPNKRKFLRRTYYLTVPVMAHILERHYYKINRHPQAGKFTIPVVELLDYLRDAADIEAVPLSGSLNFCRILKTDRVIGYDVQGNLVDCMTVLTDGGGKVVTAFPGQAGQLKVEH